MKTVTGLFSTMAQAQQAKQTLITQGFAAGDIDVVAENSNATSAMPQSTAGSGTASTGIASLGEKVGSYLKNLTGGDDEAHREYSSGLQSGGALVSVTTGDEKVQQAATALRQAGAQDLKGASGLASGQTAGRVTAENITGDTLIPVVEEQLVVGKREVDHGGVRVYSHVVERPVEAEVMLREERIVVDRQPVNRAATEADFEAGRGGTIELQAMGEEAVVGKASKVVEEVRVGKTSSEHVETIHDSVRKTEVEVEQLAGQAARTETGVTTDPTTTYRK